MKNFNYGRVINIISTSVKQPIPGLGVSNTIRGAVASWAKTLSFEVGVDGITINNILPGFTDTERLASLIDSKSQTQNISMEDVAKAMESTVPAGRFGKPEETAKAIVFLASPAAGYINGVSLAVDGGRLSCI
jgi:3-oxoacyl-[acyl-carrier protein] reductase